MNPVFCFLSQLTYSSKGYFSLYTEQTVEIVQLFSRLQKKRILAAGWQCKALRVLVNMDILSVWRTYPIFCKVRRKHCNNWLQLSVYRDHHKFWAQFLWEIQQFFRKTSCWNLSMVGIARTFQVIRVCTFLSYICLPLSNLILIVNMFSFTFHLRPWSVSFWSLVPHIGTSSLQPIHYYEHLFDKLGLPQLDWAPRVSSLQKRVKE